MKSLITKIVRIYHFRSSFSINFIDIVSKSILTTNNYIRVVLSIRIGI